MPCIAHPTTVVVGPDADRLMKGSRSMNSHRSMTVPRAAAIQEIGAGHPQRLRRASILTAVLAALGAAGGSALGAAGVAARFRRVPTQFIAALDEPGASSGNGAQSWGLWPLDPGPRGVGLNSFGRLMQAGGTAPAGWRFDAKDWWLEEHGLIMEQPDFPLPPRKYVVTGDRDVTTVLTVWPSDKNGDMRWELENGASLHDVTHLGCRAARYRPQAGGTTACSPANVPKAAFPVEPGAAMPPVGACSKQDYAVLFVIGVSVES